MVTQLRSRCVSHQNKKLGTALWGSRWASWTIVFSWTWIAFFSCFCCTLLPYHVHPLRRRCSPTIWFETKPFNRRLNGRFPPVFAFSVYDTFCRITLWCDVHKVGTTACWLKNSAELSQHKHWAGQGNLFNQTERFYDGNPSKLFKLADKRFFYGHCQLPKFVHTRCPNWTCILWPKIEAAINMRQISRRLSKRVGRSFGLLAIYSRGVITIFRLYKESR